MLSTSVMHFLADGILQVSFSTTVSFLAYCVLFSLGRKDTLVFHYHLMGQLSYENLFIALVLTRGIIPGISVFFIQFVAKENKPGFTDRGDSMEWNLYQMRFYLPLDFITMILGSKELPVTNPLQSRNVKDAETVSSLLCPPACVLMPFHNKNHCSVEIYILETGLSPCQFLWKEHV